MGAATFSGNRAGLALCLLVFGLIAQMVGMLAAERSGDVFFDDFVSETLPSPTGAESLYPPAHHLMFAFGFLFNRGVRHFTRPRLSPLSTHSGAFEKPPYDFPRCGCVLDLTFP